MPMLAKELREKRAVIATEMRSMVETIGREDRSFTQEERDKFNRMERDEQAILERAQDIEKVEAIDRSMGGERDPDEPLAARAATGKSSDGRPTRRDVNLAWRAWAKKPSKRDTRDREAAERVGFDLSASEIALKLYAEAPKLVRNRNGVELQLRATGIQNVATSSDGGAFVQNEAIRTFEEVLLAYGGMRANATVIRTETGGNLPWPKVDDTGSKGRILAENTAADNLSVGTGTVTLGAFKYTSDFVKVSMELLQDSFMDWDSYLMRQLATRIARIQNDHFTFGATAGATPEGVLTNESTYLDGVTTADTGGPLGSTKSVIYSELVQCMASLDPAYAANASWQCNYRTLNHIKAMTDGNGRPLWNPDFSLAVGQVPSILGFPYFINQSVKPVALTTSASYGSSLLAVRRVIGLGDWSKYVIRDVREVIVTRADERFIEMAQSGFIAFSRATGAPVGSTAVATCPMKWVAMKG